MQSISTQIQMMFGRKEVIIHDEYDVAVELFQDLLYECPVILFIDALDQLLDTNLSRTRLTFLQGLRPHKATRVIVSCRPDIRDDFSYGSHNITVCIIITMKNKKNNYNY